MGIVVKNNSGVDYLYSVVGNSQFFLGRKDSPGEMSQKGLLLAVDAIERGFERRLDKHVADLLDLYQYMDEASAARHASKSKSEIISRLRQLK